MIKSNRDSLLWKLEDITDDQGRQRVVGSLTTLIGLVEHLRLIERGWVRMVIDQEDIPRLWSADDPDAEWRLTEDDTVESVTTAYAEEVALVDAIIERQTDLGREVEARGKIIICIIISHGKVEIRRI